LRLTLYKALLLFRKSIFEIEGKLSGTGRIERSLKTPDIYKSVETAALKMGDSERIKRSLKAPDIYKSVETAALKLTDSGLHLRKVPHLRKSRFRDDIVFLNAMHLSSRT
jgi:hypothetical protein